MVTIAFTDDIGCALLYDFIGEIPPLASDNEYIVRVSEDDGLQVMGSLLTYLKQQLFNSLNILTK